MRILALSSLVALAACSSLPGPTPPAQGIFGYVRADDEVGATPIQSLLVGALPRTQSGHIDPTTPTVPTDEHGNFSLELEPGQWRICLVDGTTTAQCDCNVNVGTGTQIERLYLRETTFGTDVAAWAGQWHGGNPQSSCNTAL
ncbi:MAG: hypothetical protein ABI321_08940 [Polyangia bacterium]